MLFDELDILKDKRKMQTAIWTWKYQLEIETEFYTILKNKLL